MKTFRYFAAALLALGSCTVKEPRDGCPCLLKLDLDEVIASGRYDKAVATLGPCSGASIGQEMIDVAPYAGTGYEKTVPRSLVRTSLVCGFKNSIFRSDTIRVNPNLPADPIWAFALEKECTEEVETVHVSLHKQYCRMNFVAAGEADMQGYPYVLRVRAGCSGMRLYDLQPVEGDFSAVVREDSVGRLSLDVPRQKENELLLEMLDRTAFEKGNIEVVYRLDLGRKLAQTGYEWAAVDLDDVTVKIDYARASFSVEVLPWNDDYRYSELEI